MVSNSIEMLNQDISNVMESILHEITEELKDELHLIIEEKVYEAYKGWYAERGFRTYEFLESFVVENFDRVMSGDATTLTEEVLNDPLLMTQYTGFPYSHYQREELAEVIEEGGEYLFETEAPPRPFWQEWLTWCFTQIPQRFVQKCHSRGLYIV